MNYYKLFRAILARGAKNGSVDSLGRVVEDNKGEKVDIPSYTPKIVVPAIIRINRTKSQIIRIDFVIGFIIFIQRNLINKV